MCPCPTIIGLSPQAYLPRLLSLASMEVIKAWGDKPGNEANPALHMPYLPRLISPGLSPQAYLPRLLSLASMGVIKAGNEANPALHMPLTG